MDFVILGFLSLIIAKQQEAISFYILSFCFSFIGAGLLLFEIAPHFAP